jgi:menaquinone-9 beta-reductase
MIPPTSREPHECLPRRVSAGGRRRVITPLSLSGADFTSWTRTIIWITRHLPCEIDVFVIGGGPAGLAAPLAARQKGFGVVVADRASPPIDKACGEGLMPDGVAALRRLGVELTAHQGAFFRGIRFLDNDFQAEAAFPNAGNGLGIPRTALHQIMVERAEDAGVQLCWQVQVEGLEPLGVKVNGQTVRCRWIIGADGFHSRVRPPAWHASALSHRTLDRLRRGLPG